MNYCVLLRILLLLSLPLSPPSSLLPLLIICSICRRRRASAQAKASLQIPRPQKTAMAEDETFTTAWIRSKTRSTTTEITCTCWPKPKLFMNMWQTEKTLDPEVLSTRFAENRIRRLQQKADREAKGLEKQEAENGLHKQNTESELDIYIVDPKL